jgi:hypothetical protein
LRGAVIALSMSPPADLGRLGFPRLEFDRLVFELAMRVVRADGRVLYGGHLHRDSLTIKVFDHLSGAYRAGMKTAIRQPLLHYLAHDELARTPFEALVEALRSVGSFAETRVVLRPDHYLRLSARRRDDDHPAYSLFLRGAPIGELRLDGPEDLAHFIADHPPPDQRESLRRMRAAAGKVTSARIAIGGRRGDTGVAERRDVYGGEMPGIFEEAIGSLSAGRPTVLLAAYGGAARDAAVSLGLLPPDKWVDFLGPQQPGPGYDKGRARLAELASQTERDAAPLRQFAQRDDTETLARDIVGWLCQRLENEPRPDANPEH